MRLLFRTLTRLEGDLLHEDIVHNLGHVNRHIEPIRRYRLILVLESTNI